MVLIAPKHEPGDHAGQSGGDYTDARIESNGVPRQAKIRLAPFCGLEARGPRGAHLDRGLAARMDATPQPG